MAAVPVGAGLAVGLRLLQILFLHDFLALDHVMSAVGAFVLALHASGATTGTGLVVLDFGAGDLLAVFRAAPAASEAGAAGDPAEETDDEHERPDQEHIQTNDGSNDNVYTVFIVVIVIVVIIVVRVPVRIRVIRGLPVGGKRESVVGIGDRHGVALSRLQARGKDQIAVLHQAVRLPGAGFVRVPANGEVFYLHPVKPGRRVGKDRFPLDIAVDLVHVVLDKGVLKAGDLVPVIVPVQVNLQGGSLIINVVDIVGQGGDLGVIAVGHPDIHPFQGAVFLVVQDLPVDVVGHAQGGIFLHVDGDDEVLDLIGGRIGPHGHGKERKKAEAAYQRQGCQKAGGMYDFLLHGFVLFHQQYLLRGRCPDCL